MTKHSNQNGQKGKPNADTVNNMMAAEDMEKAIHPNNRQNSKQ